MSRGMALVTFETRPVEDRGASMKAGHYVGHDVDYAMITPIGGNLTHDCIVDDELIYKWKTSPELKYRHDAYLAWKEGKEPPVNGQALKTWPPISPALLKAFESRNIRSVEELAELPDDALRSFGPGTRVMRDKAREWIKASGELGRVVEEITALKTENKDLRDKDAKNTSLIEELLKRVEQLEKKKAA